MATFYLQKPISLKLVTFLLLFITANSFAQYSEEFKKHEAQYPDEQLIRLKEKTIITIQIIDEEIVIEQEIFEEDIFMKQSASQGSKGSVNSSSFFELKSIKASSFQFEKGKYKESEVEEFTSRDELDESFYDDIKTHSFIYPKLKKGSKTTLKYIDIIKNPRFLSPFYFGGFTTILDREVVIIADADISLRFKEFNTENVNIKFSKQEKRGKVIYNWSIKNLDKYEYEENVPTYKNILPHIIPIINSYTANGKTIKILENVSDLYNWYTSLIKNINLAQTDPELVNLVQTLTKDKPNDLEKVRAIYYWVQNNIKYIDYEYSLGGFIPRDANVVYKKKYGDCKDNSSILKEMLDVAELQGELTWVGTRSIPYSYTEVPTPIVDNHMILTYKYENNYYFLDATGRYTPMDFPSSFIQGKEALVAGGKQKYNIIKIPIISADKNVYKDVSTIKIENEKVIGTSKATISGYKKMNYFSYLEYETTKPKIKEFYNTRFRKGNNKFLIETLEEKNKFDYDKDLQVDYTFTIENYAKNISDEIYINLNLNPIVSYYKTEKDRVYDIGFRYKQKYQFITTLNIPIDYKVDYVPENTRYKNDYLSSETNYELKDQQIIYTHTLIFNAINLDSLQQKEVNVLIKKVQKSYKEIIVLKKKE